MGKGHCEAKDFSKTKHRETSFNLSLTEYGGVGKSHLIKTIYQSVSKVLQYHGGSPHKLCVLILASTGVTSINVRKHYTFSYKYTIL